MIRMIRRLFATLLALSLLALPFGAFAQKADAPVEGVDYFLIPGGQPWQPLKGRIEVVEIFAYWCPHCAHFEPEVETWQAKQAKDVRFGYVPSAYDLGDSYSRAFFASETLGVMPRAHRALFRAMHEEQSVPMNNASPGELAVFYGQFGIAPAKFTATMASPAIDAKMQQARAFVMASGLAGTPTLIVDGKYRVQGPTHEAMLRTTDYLIAKERAARAH